MKIFMWDVRMATLATDKDQPQVNL
uniref:Uncharacterized protein n=1 Tax=Arundo donax TaxID=35708 RepID=A0A0A9AY64_ARUDO